MKCKDCTKFDKELKACRVPSNFSDIEDPICFLRFMNMGILQIWHTLQKGQPKDDSDWWKGLGDKDNKDSDDLIEGIDDTES